jgi:hypothetical protein
MKKGEDRRTSSLILKENSIGFFQIVQWLTVGQQIGLPNPKGEVVCKRINNPIFS